MPADVKHFDVIIIGAGPAGCTAALKLAPSGLKIALVDKDPLPKEKVCGDALSGTVMDVLRRLPEDAYNSFLQIPGILPSWGIRFVAPGSGILDVPFVWKKNDLTPVPGVTCKRLEFDRFLLSRIDKYPNVSVLSGTHTRNVELSSSGDLIIVSGDNFHFDGKVVIGADGLNSFVARQLAGHKPDSRNLCLGVRGYYKGVSRFHPDNFIELHFIRELLPNYLWIFPMQEGIANVGLGLMPAQVKDNHSSPAAKLEEILSSHPGLRDRFAHAQPIGKLETHGLPVGYDNRKISGTRFLLTGDAASLVDPFTGEGIGNAMLSGEIAAKHISSAFEQNDFSGDHFSGYDREVSRKIGQEIRLSKKIRKFAAYPGLFNFVVKKSNSSNKLKDLLCMMYSDAAMRKKLTDPWFYLMMVIDPLKTSSSYKP